MTRLGFLQALSSLLKPQHGKPDTEEGTAASHQPDQPAQPDPRGLQEVVLQPKVIDVLLDTVQSASDAANPGEPDLPIPLLNQTHTT